MQMDKQIDLYIPQELAHEAGQLLSQFGWWLWHKGIHSDTQNKEHPWEFKKISKHLTPWWLYVVMDELRPTESKVRLVD